ncbi:TlpA family protein disulfide reductase [Campylobacter fetus]|uniref:TlpA family protein disulfide reductase n=3 Tax=Campylobacter fetus TaxID=196 RepID=A0A5L8VAL8_CAMFE|nr:TlpA disulfide reductase family protein [Campylobacter fetus]OCS21594.1 thioredoxin [Campylobacter fetus subsp. venerealis cfvi97/532]OCS25407.1 thioredoxin [Campylobacter fetus subsp. venerealis cfvB10]OCS28986.1 thioredoxin [Campylobacter fetus subsp. venerealis LMG 6570 = CCUG 33900]OCS42031.1 thioredoxin [Campylobacter fetus subsp. venerealis cfvi02/298]ABK81808.1 thiredoxin [Campylobacter fetus subsp. fetus 82-40]
MKSRSLIIAFLLIFAYGCSKEGKNEETAMEGSSSAVIGEDYSRAFSLSLNSGETLYMQRNQKGFDIEDNNKAVLFAFFATWCPPCKAEIPYLVNLQDKFEKNLRVVGVLMEDRTNDEIKEFIKMYNINYDIAYGDNNYFFAKALGGVVGIPFMVLYYPDGKYANAYTGMVPLEMLESDVKKVIL